MDGHEPRGRERITAPEDGHPFAEDVPIVLSDRDWERFVQGLEHPPEPNATLRRLIKRGGTREIE
jgi:hypothetical protein